MTIYKPERYIITAGFNLGIPFCECMPLPTTIFILNFFFLQQEVLHYPKCLINVRAM